MFCSSSRQASSCSRMCLEAVHLKSVSSSSSRQPFSCSGCASNLTLWRLSAALLLVSFSLVPGCASKLYIWKQLVALLFVSFSSVQDVPRSCASESSQQSCPRKPFLFRMCLEAASLKAVCSSASSQPFSCLACASSLVCASKLCIWKQPAALPLVSLSFVKDVPRSCASEGCQQLCFSSADGSARCDCEMGHILLQDGKSCQVNTNEAFRLLSSQI